MAVTIAPFKISNKFIEDNIALLANLIGFEQEANKLEDKDVWGRYVGKKFEYTYSSGLDFHKNMEKLMEAYEVILTDSDIKSKGSIHILTNESGSCIKVNGKKKKKFFYFSPTPKLYNRLAKHKYARENNTICHNMTEALYLSIVYFLKDIEYGA